MQVEATGIDAGRAAQQCRARIGPRGCHAHLSA